MTIINEPTTCSCGCKLKWKSTTHRNDYMEREYICTNCSQQFVVCFNIVCDEKGLQEKKDHDTFIYKDDSISVSVDKESIYINTLSCGSVLLTRDQFDRILQEYDAWIGDE